MANATCTTETKVTSVTLTLTLREALVLRDLLYVGVAGEDDGPRSDTTAVLHALEKAIPGKDYPLGHYVALVKNDWNPAMTKIAATYQWAVLAHADGTRK